VLEVTPTHDPDDESVGVRGMSLHQGLRHGPVPRQLRLDEAPERLALEDLGTVGRSVGGLLGVRLTRIPAGLLEDRLRQVDLRKTASIGLRGGCGVGDPFPLLFGNRAPALLGHAGDQLPVDVQCHHRQPVLAGEVEQRQVEIRVVAPDLCPARRLEEGGLRELTRDPGVQVRLHAAREHLEADHEVGLVGVQTGECVKLPAMLLGLGMGFTEEDAPSLRHRLHQSIRRQHLAGLRIEPAAPHLAHVARELVRLRAGRRPDPRGHQKQQGQPDPSSGRRTG
jgi:hypothetical protein